MVIFTRRLAGLIVCLLLAFAATAADANTLLDIKKRGKLIIGTQFSFPNWGFYDDQRKPAGFEIELANELGAAIKLPVELVETINANRIPFLETKKVDLVISVFSVTPERALSVSFTRPYAALVAVMLSKKDDGISGPKDLAGKRIAVSKGTSSADRIRSAAAPGTQFLEFDTAADTFLALKQGKVEAAAEGLDGVLTFIKENPTFAVKGQPLAPHSLISAAVRQDDPELLHFLNTWLLTLENSGRLDALYKKWFAIDRPALPR